MSVLPDWPYVDPREYCSLCGSEYLEFLYHLCQDCHLLENFNANHQWSHLKPDLIDGCLSDVLIKMHTSKCRPTQHIIAYINQALKNCCCDLNQKGIDHPIVHWDYSKIPVSETRGHENILVSCEEFYSHDRIHNYLMVDELNQIWDHFRDIETKILKLRFVEDWTYCRISKHVNIPKTTLYKLIVSLQNRLILYMIEIRE